MENNLEGSYKVKHTYIGPSNSTAMQKTQKRTENIHPHKDLYVKKTQLLFIIAKTWLTIQKSTNKKMTQCDTPHR